MIRSGILLVTMFAAALVASAPASAAEVTCIYNGGVHPCVWHPAYAYEYENPNGIGSDLESIVIAPFVLATEPLAFLTTPLEQTTFATPPLAQTETAPLVTGRSVSVSGPASSPLPGGVAGFGNYCATSVKTCVLRESGWLGTGCSCRVSGGYARGFVK